MHYFPDDHNSGLQETVMLPLFLVHVLQLRDTYSAAKVRFWTVVRTWTITNWTKSLVQSSWKSVNQTYSPVQGSGISCFGQTGSNPFEPIQNTCDFCWLLTFPHQLIMDFPDRSLTFWLQQPTSTHHCLHQLNDQWARDGTSRSSGRSEGTQGMLPLLMYFSFPFRRILALLFCSTQCPQPSCLTWWRGVSHSSKFWSPLRSPYSFRLH